MDRLKNLLRRIEMWLWIGDEVRFENTSQAFDIYQKSEKAKEILNNPVFREAMDDLKSANLEMWEAQVKSAELREYHWTYNFVLNQIDSSLQRILNQALVDQAKQEFRKREVG